jgi:L-histidine N-alpha-methyltransferase
VTYRFVACESIHTESSRKYDVDAFAMIAVAAGFEVQWAWSDADGRFGVCGLYAIG